LNRERLVRILSEGLWIALDAVVMGTFVAVAHFADYNPLVPLSVGETVIGVPLITGMVLGLLLHKDEPQSVALKGFLACAGAIVLIVLTVYLPVLGGIVTSLGDLGTTDSARIGALFTSLFVLPIHLLGTMIGRGLAELFPLAVVPRVE